MTRYNVKIIKTNSYEEIYIKTSTDLVPGTNNKRTDKKRIRRDYNALSLTEKAQSEKNKKKYYINKRFEISRIIDINHDENTKFLTLTFHNTTDLDITNYTDTKVEFDKFMKRMRRFIATNHGDKKLKYIAVHEIQKSRQAYHYHIVLFDFPYIKHSTLRDIWGNGFIKINKIPHDVSKTDVGIYISKYFAKEENTQRYQNKYYMSRNLKKPDISYVLVPEDELAKYSAHYTDSLVQQKKNYQYKRPSYSSTGTEYLEEVNVTYIRKKRTL